MALTEKEMQEALKRAKASSTGSSSTRTGVSANPHVNSAIQNLRNSRIQEEQPEQGEEQKGFFGRIGERYGEIFQTAKGAIGRQIRGEQRGMDTARQVLGKATGEAAETAFDALFTSAKNVAKGLLPKKAEEKIGDTVSSLFETEIAQKALQAIESGEEVYNQFKEKNPRAAAEVEAMLGFSEALTSAPASKVINATKVAQKLSQAKQVKKNIKAVEQVEDIIKPVMTKKEVKRALDEGRIERAGTLQKFLGKPDPVKAEKRVKDAAKTVVEEIPGAAYLSDTQIANKAKERIRLIAESVEPKLATIDFPSQTKEDILSSYLSKIEQNVGEYPLLSPSQVKRLNGDFEKILLELGDAKSADDLWKTIQKYDETVKSNVKMANTQSTESLQIQKDIWLENRRILRDALDEIVEQAEDDVALEFKKMRDLYLVRENIINNAQFFKGSGNLSKALLRAGLAGGVGAAGTTATFMFLE